MAPEINTNKKTHAHIIGWGKKLPDYILTNEALERIDINTTDADILRVSGIETRRIATESHETTAGLATIAALNALEIANISPDKIGLIVVATSSEDAIFPATANVVQDKIGAINAGAYDLHAACSGFAYGLTMAQWGIESGNIEYAVVIGAETLSRFVDYTDRNTAILFGDGAGAVVVAAGEQHGGILTTVMGSDGSGAKLLELKAGNPRMQNYQDQHIKMEGRPVFKFGVKALVDTTKSLLKKAGQTIQNLDVLISHQANIRILQAAEKELGLTDRQVPKTIQEYGNTSAATIPITIVDAIEKGQLKTGDLVALVGFGAGLSWAGALVKWSAPTDAPSHHWWKQAGLSTQRRISSIRSWVRSKQHKL